MVFLLLLPLVAAAARGSHANHLHTNNWLTNERANYRIEITTTTTA